jgi:hypothetical protein
MEGPDSNYGGLGPKYGRDALLDGKWNRERPFAEG